MKSIDENLESLRVLQDTPYSEWSMTVRPDKNSPTGYEYKFQFENLASANFVGFNLDEIVRNILTDARDRAKRELFRHEMALNLCRSAYEKVRNVNDK